MARETFSVTDIERMNLAAFVDHTTTCAQCCRSRTLSTRTKICVRGVMLAVTAGAILRDAGIGTADHTRTGIAK